MEQEIWKDVVGYEGLYKVSNFGKVMNKQNKVLVQYKDIYGYMEVCLFKNNSKRNHRVHRLVAFAFIKNDYNKSQVNHIDGNKANNNVSNLEWTTPLENIRHAMKNGLFIPKSSENAVLSMNNATKKRVAKIYNGKIIKIYDSCNSACRETNIASSNISVAANNKLGRKTAGGYEWKYI